MPVVSVRPVAMNVVEPQVGVFMRMRLPGFSWVRMKMVQVMMGMGVSMS
jgi:hypothetical protein